MINMKKAACGVFLFSLMMTAPMANAQDYSEEQIKDIVKQVIMDNPQLIMDSLTNHEVQKTKDNLASGLADIQTMLSDESLPKMGNPEGNPVGVVFLDYNCPHCRRTHDEMKAWLSENPDKSFVILDFPVLGNGSLVAAQMALAAHADGNYDVASEALISTDTPNAPDNIMMTITEAGLDAQSLATTAVSDKVMTQISRNVELAQKLGINGTPGAVFNGEVLVGAFTKADLDRMFP